MAEPTDTAPARLNFRPRQRVSHARDYQAVFGARVRKSKGPLTVFGRPNGGDTTRLGLSVGRRAGPAVRRNAIKRRVREAFRLSQRELPPGFDFVVSVRGHDDAALADYQRWLADACAGVAREWAKRAERDP